MKDDVMEIGEQGLRKIINRVFRTKPNQGKIIIDADDWDWFTSYISDQINQAKLYQVMVYAMIDLADHNQARLSEFPDMTLETIKKKRKTDNEKHAKRS